jgi:Cu/Ag efflux pump CusA
MGGIIALIFSQIYLSVSAIIGFLAIFAIFAIAILNGIVLVSFIDELREKNPKKDLKEVIKPTFITYKTLNEYNTKSIPKQRNHHLFHKSK